MLVKQQAVVQNFCTSLERFIKKGYGLRKALQAVVPVCKQAAPAQASTASPEPVAVKKKAPAASSADVSSVLKEWTKK